MGFVQSKSNLNGFSTNTVATTLTSSVTIHNLLVGFAFWNSGTATCSFADPVNGTWTAIGSPQFGVGGLAGVGFQAFYKANAGAGSTTITATTSVATGFVGLAVVEASGAAQVLPLGQFTYKADTQTTSVTTASITPTQANAYLIAAVVVSNTGFAVSGGYTLREEANWGTNAVADLQETSIVAGACTLALASDSNQLSVNIEFDPVSNGGGAAAATRSPIVSRAAVNRSSW